MKVLAVEDNEVNQTLISKFLERRGIDVTLAENGLEAVKRAEQEQYDLVLMDIQMPVMDGYASTRNMRALSEHYERVPIVAVTASMESEVRDLCREAGMDVVLLKPYTPDKLKKVPDELLLGKRG